jgi:hypothetical protein
MIIFNIILIVAGFIIDAISSITRMVAYIQRKKVPSPAILVGFLLQAWGLHGLTILAEPRAKMFEWGRWKWFFFLLGLALVLHLFIHIVLPLLFTMVCNIYYGRKLLDMSPLPLIKNEAEKEKIAL